MSDAELYTIGEVARRIGVPARTIRFWCDAGVLAPTGRSAAGYRRFDAAAVARLDLVATLRCLTLGLDDIRRVLAGTATVAEVAAVHADALDARMRVLRLHRAVLRAVAGRGSDIEEMRLMHDLARLSARERQHIIDDFVDRTFADVPPDSPARNIASGMRALPAEIPDDPTPAQLDAWIELATLVADESFRQRARQMVVSGADAGAPREPEPDPSAVIEHAGRAVAEGVDPASARGREILARLVPPDTPAAERARLRERLSTFTDERVERYWQLLGILNDRPPFPPATPAFRWLIQALAAR